jgi:Cu/Ag efflux pump CusA
LEAVNAGRKKILGDLFGPMRLIQVIGMLSGMLMPIFNIPLILRIVRRRSSGDISLVWVIGVWSCVIAMLPSSLHSPDPVLAVFGIVNAVFFSAVFFTVLYFHPALKR